MSDKSKDFLKEYHKKRDFDRTAEPFGGDRRKSDGRIFVVHKHDASNLHYDFRIEIDGVLKSWAVPKGPSTDPSDKRMAIQTEDHPLEYADFEGVIPEDQYGGGTVMVWDAGTYRNLKAEADNDKARLNDGKVDRQGLFLAGSMDMKEEAASGALYRLDKDLSCHRIETGIMVSNGPCWSPDGETFYFTDTWSGEFWAYDYDTKSGTVSSISRGGSS